MPGSIYCPLDTTRHEIRLLVLHPSYKSQRPNFEAPIKCNLRTVAFRYSDFYNSSRRFESPEPYIALSYAWGDPGQTKPITVNGVRIHVTVNLHNALRHIRKRRKRIVLWVDAVCINQEDNEEKSFQVSTLIRHIYEQAQSVIAWLGEPTPFDAKVLAIRTPVTEGGDIGEVNNLFNEILDRWDMATGYSYDLECFGRMLRMPWWSRVWVIQEVILAKHLVFKYGHLELTPNTMTHIVGNCMRLGGRIAEHGSSISSSINDNMHLMAILKSGNVESMTKMSLFNYMAFFGARQASLPHDKIYALMGLADDAHCYDPPDYTKRAEDVYISFAITLARQSRSLCFFDGAGIGPGARSTNPRLVLPSWVPDWTRLASARTWMPINNGDPKKQSLPCELRFSNSHCILHAEGVVYAVVSEVIPAPASKDSFPLRWNRFLPQNKPPLYKTGIPALQAYFRAFDFEYDFQNRKSLRDSDSASMFRSFTSFLLAGSCESIEMSGHSAFTEEEEMLEEDQIFKEEMIEPMEAFLKFTGDDRRGRSNVTILSDFFPEADAHRYLEWLENDDPGYRQFCVTEYLQMRAYYFWDRALFWTDQGLISHGYAEVRAGDIVCCLSGYHCPVILRPEGNFYIVIGHCFVVGMMYDEVMAELEQGKVYLQEISIK